MNKYYLINSGDMFEAVKSFIDSKRALQKSAIEYAEKIGAVSYFSRGFGEDSITGFAFKYNECPDGWIKPKRNGFTRPKRTSPDYDEFNSLPKTLDEGRLIRRILNLNLNISYKNGSTSGCTYIGKPFNEVGFMYCSADGPYAFWVPDVKAACKKYTDDGYIITNDADKWVMDLDGVEEISKEKWNFITAKYELEKAQPEKE